MLNKKLLSVAGVAVLASTSMAQTIFSDAAESLADYTQALGSADTEVRVVDYSNFTVAGVTHSLAEAPRQIGGSANTTGILMRVNFDTAGAATGLNMILGGTPLEITASQYRMSFDMYLGIPEADFGGSTEQGVWGVGRANATDYIGRPTRTTAGSGTWGWAAGEGGYGAEDYSAWVDTTNFGTKTDLSTEAQTAFPNNDIVGTPGDAWTTVDVLVNNGNVQVFYNGVQFWNIDNAVTSGYAMFGYEDAFSSIAAEAGEVWGIVDNVEVEVVPEPMTMTMLGVGALALLRRKRKSA